MRIFLILLLMCSNAWATNFAKRFSTDTALAVISPSGTLTNGNCAKFDANGNIVDAGAPCGSGTGTGGGTPGGANTNVQYNSSGSFAGNSGFVYDGTNVGVGNNLNAISSVNIGTTGLGVLTVRRDSAANATNELITLRNANISNNNGTTIAFQDNGSNNNQTTSYIAGIGPQHGTTPSGELAFGVSNFSATANEAMRIYHDGSIGIGTFSPTKKLSVLGNAGIGSTNYAALSASVNNGLVVEGNTGIGTYLPDLQMTVKGDSNFIGNLGIGTNQVTTSALTVMNGNVGIGTWIPALNLDVKGTVRMTGFSLNQNPSSGYVMVTNSVGIGTWRPVTSLGAGTPGGANLNLQYNNNGVLDGILGSSVVPVTGNVRLNQSLFLGTGGSGGDLHFDLSSNGIDFNGGTDTYIYADTAGIYLQTLDASSAELDLNNDGVGLSLKGGVPFIIYDGSGNPNITLDSALGFIINNSSASPSFSVDPNNRFISMPSGNWTIQSGDQSSPAYLEVASGGNDGGAGGNLYLYGGYTSPGPAGNIIMGQDHLGNARGNVGIAKNPPTSALDVGGLTTTTTFKMTNGAGNLKVLQSDASGNGSWVTDNGLTSLWATQNTTDQSLAGGNVAIGTDFTTAAKLTVMGGNVGIGTITPLSLLAIQGGNVGIGTRTSQTALSVFGNIGIGTFTATNGALILAVGKGNVGFGTISPGQLLDVQGTIRISKIGATFSLASGSNACRGQSTLSTGTVTVNTTCTPSSSDSIFITDAGSGILANIGSLSVGVVTGGTSFVLNSSNALDSSNVNWIIINKT